MYRDRVQETTTTTGTGTLTLAGAVTGFQSFNTAFSIGPGFYYTITDNTNWEVGQGQLTGVSLLSRDIVYASSNGNALVNFPAGSKNVFCTFPAIEAKTTGIGMAKMLGLAMP